MIDKVVIDPNHIKENNGTTVFKLAEVIIKDSKVNPPHLALITIPAGEEITIDYAQFSPKRLVYEMQLWR